MYQLYLFLSVFSYSMAVLSILISLFINDAVYFFVGVLLLAAGFVFAKLKYKWGFLYNKQTVLNKLHQYGLINGRHVEIRSFEDHARQQIVKAMTGFGIHPDTICNSHSSFGFCAFCKNIIYLGITVGDAPPQGSEACADAYQYFCEDLVTADMAVVADVFSRSYKKSPEEYGALIQHLDYTAQCVYQPVTVTAKVRFNANNLVYFKIEGDTQYVSDVSGGGANIEGAIVGGLIAGGVGAIVGSQTGTNISTKIAKKDDRKLILYFEKDGRNITKTLEADNMDSIIALFRKWIPQKEYHNIIMERAQPSAPVQPAGGAQDSSGRKYQELLELKELLDLGILSQEEFDTKKKQLLGI